MWNFVQLGYSEIPLNISARSGIDLTIANTTRSTAGRRCENYRITACQQTFEPKICRHSDFPGVWLGRLADRPLGLPNQLGAEAWHKNTWIVLIGCDIEPQKLQRLGPESRSIVRSFKQDKFVNLYYSFRDKTTREGKGSLPLGLLSLPLRETWKLRDKIFQRHQHQTG